MAVTKRQRAARQWQKSNGMLTNKELAQKLEVSASTIARWKREDRWLDLLDTSDAASASRKEYIKKCSKELVEDAELSDREQIFVAAYADTHNIVTSYFKAGFQCTKNTAYTNGHRLLQRPHVQAALKKIQQMKMETLMISSADIVERMMRIAFADIFDFVRIGRLGDVVYLKSAEECDGGVVKSIKNGKEGVSIELEDKFRALEWLAKYFEINPEDKHRKDYNDKKMALEERKMQLAEKTAAASMPAQNDGEDKRTVVFYLPDNKRD